MFIWYIDNSDRNIDANEQREVLKQYAQENSYSIDIFLNDTDIKNIINNVNSKNNTLIIANIACLGSKLQDVVENIEFLISNGFEVISVKENVKFNNSEENKQILKGIRLSVDLRYSMTSIITRKGLDNRRSLGLKLGPAFGSKRRKNWSDLEGPIRKMLSGGMTRKQVADKLGISVSSVYNFIQLNPEFRKLKED